MHIYTRLLELVKNKIEYGDLDLRQYLRDREEREYNCAATAEEMYRLASLSPLSRACIFRIAAKGKDYTCCCWVERRRSSLSIIFVIYNIHVYFYTCVYQGSFIHRDVLHHYSIATRERRDAMHQEGTGSLENMAGIDTMRREFFL